MVIVGKNANTTRNKQIGTNDVECCVLVQAFLIERRIHCFIDIKCMANQIYVYNPNGLQLLGFKRTSYYNYFYNALHTHLIEIQFPNIIIQQNMTVLTDKLKQYSNISSHPFSTSNVIIFLELEFKHTRQDRKLKVTLLLVISDIVYLFFLSSL